MWVAFPFSRESSQPKDQTQVSCTADRFFTTEPQGSPRILEQVACSFYSGSSWPRNQTGLSCIECRIFTSWAIREALLWGQSLLNSPTETKSSDLRYWNPVIDPQPGLENALSVPGAFLHRNRYQIPGGSDGKESAFNAGDPGLIPGLERSPREEWQPTLLFLPGKSHGQRSLAGYRPWGCKETNTTERITLWLSFSTRRDSNSSVFAPCKQLLSFRV